MHRNSLLHNLGYTSRLVHRKLHENLEELGLYQGQPQLLAFLMHQDGSSQRDIGEWMDIRPATITKMVARMEKAGFVERRRDLNDKRSMQVFLTDKARETMQILQKDMQEQEETAFQGFTAEEKLQFNGLLMRVRENLGVTGHPCRRKNI
ncbi:MarR family transcriptional regulator [Clostridia bacterium]|nr:MarR family transcriptional regulator [Clostridia bacterium]